MMMILQSSRDAAGKKSRNVGVAGAKEKEKHRSEWINFWEEEGKGEKKPAQRRPRAFLKMLRLQQWMRVRLKKIKKNKKEHSTRKEEEEKTPPATVRCAIDPRRARDDPATRAVDISEISACVARAVADAVIFPTTEISGLIARADAPRVVTSAVPRAMRDRAATGSSGNMGNLARASSG